MSDRLYAIVTHGKIKSFEQLGHAKHHNDRSVKVLPDNVLADGPAPVTLVGEEGANLGDVAKAKLRSHGLDPAKLRKNAVIANEDIHSASPAFFGEASVWRARSPEEWRRDPWVVATVAFLKKVHSDNLISAVLHLDENTPHIHAVTIPLVEKPRAKRGRMSNAERALPASERQPRPTVTSVQLDCRSLRGQEKWQLESFVTEYAKAVEHLGLARGRMISKLTKEERSVWSEKASPRIADAKRALSEEAERVRSREIAASAKAAEADAERGRLSAQALAIEGLKVQAKLDRERELASHRRHAQAAAEQAAETERLKREARQLLEETRKREADVSRREAEVALRDKGASDWDDHLSRREDELEAEIAKLAKERSLFEKTKAEFLRRFQQGISMLRAFFVAKGMVAEVDVLDGRTPRPSVVQHADVAPTAVMAAEHLAELRRPIAHGR